MGWFSKKKKVIIPYTPQGRIGYRRMSDHDYTIVVEEIGKISHRSKLRILEIDIDISSTKTKKQCLNSWGFGTWVRSDFIHWETLDEKLIRLNQTPPSYLLDEDDLIEETNYRVLTQHNFIEND